MMRTVLLITLSALALQAADNSLTPAEKKDGWKLLFDGRTYDNWRTPADSWAIENGMLTTTLKPRIEEDLISAKSYGDFELQFDWRVSEGANTGVKYRIQRTVFLDPTEKGPFEANVQRQIEHPSISREKLAPGARGQEYTVAYEMQLIDDLRHPDAKKDQNHVTGALYSMLAPVKHPAHPAGEWNHSRLILKGMHFEHWINGEQVLSGALDDPAGLANLKKRWQNGPAVYEMLAHPNQTGPFSLQHHGDKVWFRNLKIKELP
ncbi:MAG TPA: DUF1080 domain-containing protein [Bryobacteraceae bacterium]|nr:DUF1080 domain-containing protein [Bryobacteraceae bacterium]